MGNGIKQILEPYFQKLPELRGSPSLWTEYKCSPATDAEGHFIDTNHRERTNLLVSLFYDQRTSDENLLRYLLKQEIEMHRQLTLQGVHESIKIGIALLSRFRHVDNIELFICAKRANFDTLYALDSISYINPGITRSYEQLPNLSEQSRKDFIEALGHTPKECKYNEQEVSEWLENQARILPNQLDGLSLDDEIYMANLLGNTTTRDNIITNWKAGIKKWDKETYLSLYGYEIIRGNIQGQIDALKKVVEHEVDKSTYKQWHYYHLSELYLKMKNNVEAYRNICSSLENYASGSMQWGECRMYLDRFLDITLAINDKHDPNCLASFKWIKNYLDYTPWMKKWDVKMIPKIMTASAIVGDYECMKKFSDLFTARKQEHDDKNS